MNVHVAHQRRHGLTRLDVLAIIAVLVILGIMLVPALAAYHQKALKIICANNLKENGLAFRIWSGDHEDKYPMLLSVTNGGAMELMGGENTWRMYLVMSNQPGTAKFLHCPADTNGFAATNFSIGFNRQNISYFINPDASDADPLFIMSGDDNLEVGGKPVKPGLLEISSKTPMAWSGARHHFTGNLAMSDGSVQQVSNSMLTNLFSATNVLRLAIP